MAKLNKQTSLKSKTPWLNTDGTKKTDREIAKLGEEWPPEIWNLYLESEVGTLADEHLVFYEDMDTDEILERSDVLRCLQDCRYHETLEAALLIALDQLSRTERTIITEAYWNQATDKEISKKLRKTQDNVRVLRSRAIKKLGHILVSPELKNRIFHFKNRENHQLQISQYKQRVS